MFRRMTRERYLSDAELDRFMAVVRERRHVHQPRDYALFALLSNTGIRPSEARALTRADCHLEGARPWVRVWRLKKKKATPEFDDLPIPESVAAALALTAGERPFAMNPRQMQRLFHHYREQAGIRRINLYSLRHAAATRLYVATRDIRMVQAVLGHETANMSTLYAHIPDRVLVEHAQRFPVAL